MHKKILIIDDYVPLLNSLRIALELNQYQVEISQSTACLLEDNRILPDVLLVDHHLPNQYSLDWLQQLKKNLFKSIPIILMSGDMDIEKIAPRLEVDDFITKPINISGLLNKLTVLTL